MADFAGKWNIEKPDFWLGTWVDKMDSWQFQCHLELPTPKLLQLADILCDFWQPVNFFYKEYLFQKMLKLLLSTPTKT